MPASDLTVHRGSVTYGTGKFGQCRTSGVLAGVMDDFLGTVGVSTPLGTGTFEMWVKFPAATTTRIFMAHRSWWWLGHDATGNLVAYVGNGGGQVALTSTQQLDNDQWWHIALVLNAGAPSLYAGQSGTGNRVATSASVDNGDNDGTIVAGSCAIGGFNSTETTFDFGGSIDDVRSSTVARYSGTTYTVPTSSFVTDANTYGIWTFDGTLAQGAAAPTVTPTAPTFTDLSGTGSDTYTIPTTVGVNYQIAAATVAAGTYAGSGTVTITAAPQSGYALTGTTTWSYTFVATATVTPTAPTFTDTAGTDDDTYTIPATTGVNYQISGSTVAAGTYPGTGTVTITAAAQGGYVLTGSTSWTHTFSTAGVYRWRFGHEPLVYSGGAYPVRPAGAKSVTWIGPSLPAGWLPNDVWMDNS